MTVESYPLKADVNTELGKRDGVRLEVNLRCDCLSSRPVMARYEHSDMNAKYLAVDLSAQLLPGTFEHELNHLVTTAI